MGETIVVTIIGRGESKEERRAHPIFLDEWQDLVDRDATLQYVDSMPVGRDPRTGQPLRRKVPWSARWTAHPRRLPVAFQWNGDYLAMKLDDEEAVLGEMDEATREKVEQVASALGARVYVSRIQWDDD